MKTPHFKYIYFLLIVFSNSAFSFETHCENEQQVIFNCKIINSTKIVSVCRQALAENQDEKYLQYKYGTLNKVELTFPNKHNIKEGQYSYRKFYSRNSGTLDYDLLFNIGRNKYHIYWNDNSVSDGEPSDKVVISSGIYVSANNGKSIHLGCSNDVIQNFESSSAYNIKDVDEF
jgi:metal-dependent hydrolase (beta-lactamase superfamily II)